MEDKIFKFMENNNPNKSIMALAALLFFFIFLINWKAAIILFVGGSIVGILFFVITWKSVYDYHKNNR